MDLIAGARAGGNVRLFSLARHALREVFSIIGVEAGDKVLIPGFVCRDILPAVHAVRAEAAYFPVARSLAPSALPVLHGVKAVLAVNYFGFPQELAVFREYCVDHGAVLIEDNAHGFLSCDAQGNALGSRGDFGIVSMRKTFALPDGGALLVNAKGWTERLAAPLACRNDRLPASFVAKRALARIQNATGIRVRTLGEQIARGCRWIVTGHALPVSLPESETEDLGDPAIHCESINILSKIQPAQEVHRRRRLYREFDRLLRGLDIEPVFGGLPAGVAPFGYPFRASRPEAAAVSRIASKKGVNCSYWPDLPSEVVPDAPDYYRNVWWVNFQC